MERLSEKLADRLVLHEIVEECDRDFYRYAVESLLLDVVNIAVMTLLAVGLGIVPESCVFLAFFHPLRTNCGGVHLKKWYTCCAASCILVCLIALSADYITIGWTVLPFSAAVCQFCIRKMAPCVHENHPLDPEARKRCREKAGRNGILVWGIVLVLKIIGLEKWAMLGWSAQTLNAVLMAGAFRGSRNDTDCPQSESEEPKN